MTQYCSVCKEHFEMEVIRQGSNETVVWLKCPGCRGFLPYMPDGEGGTVLEGEGQGKSGDIALEDLDTENAREYCEDQEFEVGEILHHRSWNDYGRVVAKGKLPGNRKTIWVQFLRQGRVQLLEGVK